MEPFIGAFTEQWERRKAAEAHARQRQLMVLIALDEEERRRKGGGGGGGSAGSRRPKQAKISFKSQAAFPRPSKPVVFDRPQTVRMEGLASGSQPAVVKMASFGGGSRLGAMLNYVSRSGDLKLENHLGQQVSGQEDLREIRSDWQSLMSNRTESRDVAGFSIEISGQSENHNTDELALSVLKAGLGDRHFVYSVSANRNGGINVSGVAVLRNSQGERLSADAKANMIVADRLRTISADQGLRVSFRFRGYGNGVEYGSYKVRELVAHSGDAVKNENGRIIRTHDEAGDLVQKNWRQDMHSRKGRDVMHVIMSARPGTDINAFQSSVRDFLSQQFGGHKYVFAVHDEVSDTKEASAGGKRPHVHAHAIITMKSEAGIKLQTTPETFRQWREVLAEKARDNGIRMEMNDRREFASAPAYSSKQVRPIYNNDNIARTEHEPVSASAAARYNNKRDNVSQIAQSARSRDYALNAAVNWQKVAMANANTQIATHATQYCAKIIDTILEVQTDQSGKVIAFNPNHSVAAGVAAVISLAQEATSMPNMNRQEFEAYEKVAEQNIHKVEQIIPEANRADYEEVIALARKTIDTERSLMIFNEQEAEREQSINIIKRSVESDFAEFFAQKLDKNLGEQKHTLTQAEGVLGAPFPEMPAEATEDHTANKNGLINPEEDNKKRHGYPEEVEKHLYVREEKNGEQHRVFYDHKGEREMFVDNGERMLAKTFDAHAVRIMVETAAHRGWTSIDVTGSAEFRREAWVEAQAHGITAKGYKPTELDWQEVERREQAYLKNEISNSDREMSTRQVQSREAGHAGSAIDTRSVTEKGQEPTRAAAPTFKEGVEGKLLETGIKPYKDDPKNEKSPYVVMETGEGEKTIWGVGIPDALDRAGVKVGDKINLREDGIESVKKPIIKEVDGKKVRETIEVDRRAWKAEMLERPEAKIEQKTISEVGRGNIGSNSDHERANLDQLTVLKEAETVRTDPPAQHVNRAEDMGWNHDKDTEHER